MLAFAAVFMLGAEVSGAQTPPGDKTVVAVQKNAEPLPAARQWKQTIGDWVVKCSQVGSGRKGCAMSQTLSNARTRRTIAVWSIGRNAAGKLTSTLRMPTGVALESGVAVELEKQKPFNVGYSACFRFGCFAPFELTAPLLDRMRKASTMTAVAQAGKRPLSVRFSLRGFPKAYDAFLQETR